MSLWKEPSIEAEEYSRAIERSEMKEAALSLLANVIQRVKKKTRNLVWIKEVIKKNENDSFDIFLSKDIYDVIRNLKLSKEIAMLIS